MFIPRFLLAWAFCFVVGLGGSFIATLGHKRGTQMPRWRTDWTSFVLSLTSRVLLFIIGVVWVKKIKVPSDYSKYLGPEWESKNAKYNGASTLVMNHQSFSDILAMLYLVKPTPGFIAKDSVRQWPAIGYISEVILSSLFVSRSSGHEEKLKVVNQIKERQQNAEKGITNPICIFPEGATTNGEGLLKFKKGAFESMMPVQPICMKYWSARCNFQHGDASSTAAWICMTLQTVVTTFTVYQMPIFEPNEYFWLNHWNAESEEKWEAYARVIRTLIAE